MKKVIDSVKHNLEGEIILFDKESFDKFKEGSDLTNLPKKSFLQFGPQGEIQFGTGIIELLDTHLGTIGNTYINDKDIFPIVISTTDLELGLKKKISGLDIEDIIFNPKKLPLL